MECTSCGNKLIFSADKNNLLCSNCGHEEEIKTDTAIGKSGLSKASETIAIESGIIHCKSCGADSATKSKVLSKNCSYCGSPTIGVKTSDINMPDNIVGFSIKKEVAKENVKGWLSKLWFAPNAIKSFASTSSMHELKGCYIPFWCFDANTQINYSGERGQYRYETRTREVDGKQESVAEPFECAYFC